MPPFATGKMPVTPVVSGKPVALVSVAADGVPRFGVVKAGEVAKTSAPLPVSSVTSALSSAEVSISVESRNVEDDVHVGTPERSARMLPFVPAVVVARALVPLP